MDSIQDGIINKEVSIVFIKIDVEGYELNVIRGAIETIRTHMPVIQIEFAPMLVSLEVRKEILNTLYRLGYITFSRKAFNINEENEIFFVNSKEHTVVTMCKESAKLLEFRFIE